MRIHLPILSLALLGTIHIASASDEDAALFAQKCAACHITTRPKTREEKMNLVAPPAAGVMWHIKQEFPDRRKALAFIVDYAAHPDAKKAICPSIRRFGVMPDLGGTVTKEELEKIAAYWYDNFPPADYKHPKMQGMGRGMGRGMHR